jgi:hypothetical protein
MRQSEGNKTAKRPSAIWLVGLANREVSKHEVTSHGGLVREAIEGPATAALAWAARIRSPLLLKTASLMPARDPCRAGETFLALAKSIAAWGQARQRSESYRAAERNLRLCLSSAEDALCRADPGPVDL